MNRRLLLAGMALALSGCGFRPLYMPQDNGPGSVAGNELAAISVPVLGERSGQLMRQALQRRLEGSGTGIAKKYELSAQPAISAEGIAIQRDSSVTRYRMTANVTWYLRRLDVAHTLLASGSARIIDGFNINNQEYFASDMAGEAATKRVVESLADQVTLQVAIYLRRAAAAEAAGKAPATAPVVVTAPSAPTPPQVPVDLLAPTPSEQFEQAGLACPSGLKVDGRRVGAFIKDPGPVRVALLYGEDEGLVRSRAEALTIAVAGATDDPFRVAWLGRDEHDRLSEEASAIAMLGGRRVIRVREVTDGLTATAARIAGEAGDSLVILEAGALPRRSKLVVLLEGLPNGAAVACYPEEGPGLRAAIEAGLAAEGVRPDSDALDWLRDHLGGDHASTRGEIEKLILYAGDAKRLDLDAVRSCVGDQASVSLDDALYAAALGDVVAADIAVERSFADGIAAVGLVRAVLLFFSRLHAARGRMEQGASPQEAVKAMRPPVFWKREGDMTRAISLWSVTRLMAAVLEARRAELACKQTGSPDDLIARRLVMALARQGAAARRR